jgi:hypothetical protein
VHGQLNWSPAEILTGEEAVPASEAPWVTICPLSWMVVKIEALTRCYKKLSACSATVVLTMFFSHWYTSLTPSMEGMCMVSRSAAAAATFWLALAKVGSWHSACSIVVVWPTSSADSCWCKSGSLASMATCSPVRSPHCCAALCSMSSCGACRRPS